MLLVGYLLSSKPSPFLRARFPNIRERSSGDSRLLTILPPSLISNNCRQSKSRLVSKQISQTVSPT